MLSKIRSENFLPLATHVIIHLSNKREKKFNPHMIEFQNREGDRSLILNVRWKPNLESSHFSKYFWNIHFLYMWLHFFFLNPPKKSDDIIFPDETWKLIKQKRIFIRIIKNKSWVLWFCRPGIHARNICRADKNPL